MAHRKNKIEQFADNIIDFVNKSKPEEKSEIFPQYCLNNAYETLSERFDSDFGGFGSAPKFPMAHGLSFLLAYHKQKREPHALEMAEKTLQQMYKGGIFDHIGYGFSRYSTDSKWLVPHFEKMLYDNALLIMAYTQAYEATGNRLYEEVTQKTITYILRTLLDAQGGFYCAQDADSEGVEGKYYVFRPSEIKTVLGDVIGDDFNQHFDITEKGNFEGSSIPNLIASPENTSISTDTLQKIYDYRKARYQLHLDDKILTAWNGLMIGALATAYQQWKDKTVLDHAMRAAAFIKAHLTEEDHIYTSYRKGKRTNTSFIDDYAFYIFALLKLYQVTFDETYLQDAHQFAQKAVQEFYDDRKGGFYLYGLSGEKLFTRPKEIYDGAIPSGNSVMAYNLLYLSKYFKTEKYEQWTKQHFDFMLNECFSYPSGNTFFLTALLLYENPPKEIVCVLENAEGFDTVIQILPPHAVVTILKEETLDYPLKDGKTTFYICEQNHCLPPTNIL